MSASVVAAIVASAAGAICHRGKTSRARSISSGRQQWQQQQQQQEEEEEEEEEEVTTAEFEFPLASSATSASSNLFDCAAKGDVTHLRRLLNDGSAHVDDVDVDGFSALMIAAAEGHRAVALELLAHGADVAVRTLELRSTALHFAAKNRDAEVVRAICEKDPRYVDCLNINTDTPLIWACIEGRADCVRVLLAYNADVNVVNQLGATTLICAVMIGEDPDEDESDDARVEIITMLLSKNPKLLNFQDREGSTAMHLAAACGYLQCVKTLLAHGADITLRNAIGQTPLEEAEQTGLVESAACVDHLRAIWHTLEEEAAARMLSMLEMEEVSARSSRAHSGATSRAGGAASNSSSASNAAAASGGGKKSKKKNKKLKRKAAKQQAQGAGDAGFATASADVGDGLLSVETAVAASTEDGSTEESSDDEEASDKVKYDERDVKKSVAVRGEEGEYPVQAEDIVPVEDSTAVAGVWTTVGKKPSRFAVASRVNGDVATAHPHTQASSAAAPSAQHLTSNMSATGKVVREVSFSSQRIAPTRRKTLKPQPQGNNVSAAAKASGASAVSAARTASSSSSSVSASSNATHAPSAPSRAPSTSFGSQIGATHPTVPYSSTPIFNNSSSASSSSSSPFTSSLAGRAHERVRTHLGFPSSWRSASLGFGLSVSSNSSWGNGYSSANRSLLWKYAHRIPDKQRTAAEATSNWIARFHLSDDRVSKAITWLACGICGELAQDNRQCNVSVNRSGCAQLYCSACVEKVSGNTPLAGSLTHGLKCVKCHQVMTKNEMRTNHFAQAQACSLQQSSGGSTLFSQVTSDAHLSMEEMRHTLEASISTAAIVDLNPFFLTPGSDLTALSNSQLEVLEQAHQLALTQIMETRIANARAQERMQIEERMKTQRDILHYTSMAASSVNIGAGVPQQ